MSHPFTLTKQQRNRLKKEARADVTVKQLCEAIAFKKTQHVYYFLKANNLPYKSRVHKPRTVKKKTESEFFNPNSIQF